MCVDEIHAGIMHEHLTCHKTFDIVPQQCTYTIYVYVLCLFSEKSNYVIVTSLLISFTMFKTDL